MLTCRHCGHPLSHPVIDLGTSPPANAYLDRAHLQQPELWYPLRVWVCEQCWLVQTEDFTGAEQLFTADYAYFSSYASSWLAHAQRYVQAMQHRFHLDSQSFVIEVAANDGYLLQYVQAAGIPCLGIEPTAATAAAARTKGIPIQEAFFGVKLAQNLRDQGIQADLVVANNVLAHVPDINDFVAGFPLLLKPTGVVTFEFQHVQNVIEKRQFDTIYHEHFSYLSFHSASHLLEHHGLRVFDVEILPTHGGSLRVFAQRQDQGIQPISAAVAHMITQEQQAGIPTLGFYQSLQSQAESIKNDLISYLISQKNQGKKVIGYGAAAKGNTLLNFAGIRQDLLAYVADSNPAKQGKFLPGSRIPIVPPSKITLDRPDVIMIIPWNLESEIRHLLHTLIDWPAQTMVAIPHLRIHDLGTISA